MLNGANWNVMEIELNCSTDTYPTATATLELELDPKRIPYHCGVLMDDLRERLGTQPKIRYDSLYGYFKADAVSTASCFDRFSITIKKVIFNKPATIIVWFDGSKTVVKCQPGDVYDPEKGFVMAYLKKLLGNDNTFNKEIAKWVGGAAND